MSDKPSESRERCQACDGFGYTGPVHADDGEAPCRACNGTGVTPGAVAAQKKRSRRAGRNKNKGKLGEDECHQAFTLAKIPYLKIGGPGRPDGRFEVKGFTVLVESKRSKSPAWKPGIAQVERYRQEHAADVGICITRENGSGGKKAPAYVHVELQDFIRLITAVGKRGEA